jgi:hypothetical protein
MRSSNPTRNLNSTSDIERQSFLSELQIFLKTRNKSISRIPTLGHKELDLMGLYREVLLRGGVEEVSIFLIFLTLQVIRNKQWHNIVKALQLPSTCTNAAFALRTHYLKYLKEYEAHQKGLPYESNSDQSQEEEDGVSEGLMEEDSMDEEIIVPKKRKFSTSSVDQETSKKYKMVRRRKFF